MSTLIPYTQGRKWTLQFGENDTVVAALTGTDTVIQCKRHKTVDSFPNTGEWVFIPSDEGFHSLAWFVRECANFPKQFIFAMDSARDIHLKVFDENIYRLPNTIAKRYLTDCIRLSDPPPYRDALLCLARETIRSADLNWRHGVKHLSREEQLPKKMEDLQQRLDHIKRFTDASVHALLRRLPMELRRRVLVEAGVKL
jgi:hypothetical protein